MKVESIKCRSAKPEGDKLVVVLEGTSFEEIENVLVGKDELSVYTDNQDKETLTEKHYDFAKADSCKYDYDQQTFVLTLRKLSDLEKRVKKLEEQKEAKL